jgi:alpha-tubulin suppressor-like RCC1 family protein
MHGSRTKLAVIAAAAVMLLALLALAFIRFDMRVRTAGTGEAPAFCAQYVNLPVQVPGLTRVVAIDSYIDELVAVDAHGRLWTYFQGWQCQKAKPKLLFPGKPFDVEVPDVKAIAAVSSGNGGQVALADDGRMLQWLTPLYDGCVSSGVPCGLVKVVGIPPVRQIASGYYFALALDRSGDVWSAGYNDCGQLARPDGLYPRNVLRPPHGAWGMVHSIHNVSSIAAGFKNGVALKADGSVWQWGVMNEPYIEAEMRPRMPADHVYCYYTTRVNGQDAPGVQPQIKPTKVSGLSKVVAISTHYAFALALKSDGSVWGWGHDDCGQLGRVPPNPVHNIIDEPVRIDGLPPIVSIAAGKRHALALDRTGQVWGWGYNDNTETGSDTFAHEAGVLCVADHAQPDLAGYRVRPVAVKGLGHVVAIAAGDNLSAALTDSGRVWVWGIH